MRAPLQEIPAASDKVQYENPGARAYSGQHFTAKPGLWIRFFGVPTPNWNIDPTAQDSTRKSEISPGSPEVPIEEVTRAPGGRARAAPGRFPDARILGIDPAATPRYHDKCFGFNC